MRPTPTLQSLDTLIPRKYPNTAGTLILQNGVPLYEHYFHNFTPDSAFHIFSLTKSILSLLFGITRDRNLLPPLDTPILHFFPEHILPPREKTAPLITLRHMLTMTAPFNYFFPPYKKYFTSPDWVEAALSHLGGRGKIGRFRYTPLIGPDIFSGILTRLTRQSVRAFACENLFDPLGISVPVDITFATKEEQIDTMKNRHLPGWVTDPKGIHTAGWGLFLTLPALAAIGQLCLDRGQHKGRQLISADWLEESTRPQSHWHRHDYGYLWWVVDPAEHSFAALGDGGNTLYINPAKNLVVAMAALFNPFARDRISFIRKTIEPLLP